MPITIPALQESHYQEHRTILFDDKMFLHQVLYKTLDIGNALISFVFLEKNNHHMEV